MIELPRRKYFSKTVISKSYKSTNESMLHNIRNIKFYSATIDQWSSINGDPYMSLTMHYVTEEWQLQSTALGTLCFPKNHTIENISNSILKKHFSHGIVTVNVNYALLLKMAVIHMYIYCILSKQFLGGHACHPLDIICILQLDTP